MCVGITSMSHERNRDLLVKNIKPEHPVMKGFPAEWPNPADELYKNEKIWPTATPLAKSYGEDTKMDHVNIWVNTYGKANVFSTTLGPQQLDDAKPGLSRPRYPRAALGVRKAQRRWYAEGRLRAGREVRAFGSAAVLVRPSPSATPGARREEKVALRALGIGRTRTAAL